MSAQTGISWTDSTFNPWIGCTKVSPARDNCYAERDMAIRLKTVTWGAGQPRKRTSPANWKLPERWNREEFFRCACGARGAGRLDCSDACDGSVHGTRRRVFCASLADWLDNEVPIEWLVDLIDLIRRTPNLDWLLLTKRIGNWRPRLHAAVVYIANLPVTEDNTALGMWLTGWLGGSPPAHVQIGGTMEDQSVLERDLLKLLAVPAAVRFLSIEPMLGPMNIGLLGTLPGDRWSGYQLVYEHLHWVICGGESGPKARPMHPDWIRSLRDECADAGVPFHFKQWGEWTPGENVERRTGTVDAAWRAAGRWMRGREDLTRDDGHRDDEPDLYRVGKKAAGRLLDGRTWDEFPRSAA